jgi:steroid delta-isomerase-like uncharacterized protein
MSEQNKEVLRQFMKAWDAGDIDSFGDFISKDTVDHQLMPGLAPGLEGVKQIGGMLRAAFPDSSSEIHHVIAEGDFVAALATGRGTHTGDFMGMPATGRSFEVNEIHIVRVDGGKMVEHWGLGDQAGMMTQLGLMPAPPVPDGWRPPPTSPQVTGDDSGDPDAHRAAMDRMIAGVRKGSLDEVLGVIAPDVVDHSALPGQAPGKDGVQWRFEQIFGGLSEPNFTVLASVGEGPFLSQAFTFTATHTGPLMGIPATGKSFEIAAIDFARFDNGMIRELWGVIDIPAMMTQLGLMPAPE